MARGDVHIRPLVKRWEDLPEVEQLSFKLIAQSTRAIDRCIRIRAIGTKEWGYWKEGYNYTVSVDNHYVIPFLLTVTYPFKVYFLYEKYSTNRGIEIPK